MAQDINMEGIRMLLEQQFEHYEKAFKSGFEAGNKVKEEHLYSLQKNDKTSVAQEKSGRSFETHAEMPSNQGHDGKNVRTDSNIEKNNMYFMGRKKKGICVIFNQINFHGETYLKRSGSENDGENIKALFEEFGFDSQLETDLIQSEIHDKITSIVNKDYSDYDCFALFFLSHGTENSVYSSDNEEINLQTKIFDKFTADNCKTLAGKPKLFFIQACRGDKQDKGIKIEGQDSLKIPINKTTIMIPNTADFLICYSTVSGYPSYRDPTGIHSYPGAWFIKALISVFRSHYTREDVLSMMTKVKEEVITKYTPEYNETKPHHRQCGSTVSTLRKKVYLYNRAS